MTAYDVIVIGTGGIGSAAAFHLARRNLRVLGLDRFGGVHDRGSSYGKTRMIRQAYCEHPDYVPLAQRSFELWEELEQRTGQKLYHEVGVLEVGPPDGMVIPGVLQSAEQHGLKVDRLDEKQLAERFPGFTMPVGSAAVFEQRGGCVMVEDCVRAHQSEAVKLGADLQSGVTVTGWEVEGNGVVVQTDKGNFSAGRLVITAGPWTSQLLTDLNVKLTVVRKPQNWFANDDDRYRADRGCPGFLYEVPDGIFYGFPALDELGVKIGEHSGGREVADPTNIDREIDKQQRAKVGQFLQRYLPGVSSTPTAHSVCMYTNSPDGHFLVDQHPAHQEVAFVAGLSGHGYKFAPVFGEVLADLTIDGATRLPIDFLSCKRF